LLIEVQALISSRRLFRPGPALISKQERKNTGVDALLEICAPPS